MKCEHCNNQFADGPKHKRFCSVRCRRNASKKRRRASIAPKDARDILLFRDIEGLKLDNKELRGKDLWNACNRLEKLVEARSNNLRKVIEGEYDLDVCVPLIARISILDKVAQTSRRNRETALLDEDILKIGGRFSFGYSSDRGVDIRAFEVISVKGNRVVAARLMPVNADTGDPLYLPYAPGVEKTVRSTDERVLFVPGWRYNANVPSIKFHRHARMDRKVGTTRHYWTPSGGLNRFYGIYHGVFHSEMSD